MRRYNLFYRGLAKYLGTCKECLRIFYSLKSGAENATAMIYVPKHVKLRDLYSFINKTLIINPTQKRDKRFASRCLFNLEVLPCFYCCELEKGRFELLNDTSVLLSVCDYFASSEILYLSYQTQEIFLDTELIFYLCMGKPEEKIVLRNKVSNE